MAQTGRRRLRAIWVDEGRWCWATAPGRRADGVVVPSSVIHFPRKKLAMPEVERLFPLTRIAGLFRARGFSLADSGRRCSSEQVAGRILVSRILTALGFSDDRRVQVQHGCG